MLVMIDILSLAGGERRAGAHEFHPWGHIDPSVGCLVEDLLQAVRGCIIVPSMETLTQRPGPLVHLMQALNVA